MYLIADSGSTKTDWCLCNQGTVLQNIQTPLYSIQYYSTKKESKKHFLSFYLNATVPRGGLDSLLGISK